MYFLIKWIFFSSFFSHVSYVISKPSCKHDQLNSNMNCSQYKNLIFGFSMYKPNGKRFIYSQGKKKLKIGEQKKLL
jgi:hypothetical protein